MIRRSSRFQRMSVLAVAAAAVAFTVAPAGADNTAFPVQLVTVDTPTRAHKTLLTRLGLDLTEHAGHNYVEVVLHTVADADALRRAGLTWQVRIPDMVAREAQVNAANQAYADVTAVSPLPSGRDTYRTLAEYSSDMAALVTMRPDLVKSFDLPHKSLDGNTVRGIEIGRDVRAAEDGRPVFAIMGVHHAREWPSGEHTIEFAYDLVKNYGQDSRITALLDKARVLVVPVVNVDGFDRSRTDGALIDLRETDNGGTATILGTPGNAYKRKNCRVIDGVDTPDGTCALAGATSPGGFGIGVDPNRNYGGFWGGPGASDLFADPTYRGAGPFSEPETQNIRELVSGRHVTTLITNHTFSNLVLRPNGVHPDTIGPGGLPVGDAPDEAALKALGANMSAQNGYKNQHGWELYDTTGTTEDWSYNATGGFGYTFEIGPDEFHPPFPKVIDEYLGAGAYAGKGNREAYLVALTNTVDTATHSVIAGKAPAGATLRLRKEFATPTWSGHIPDRLNTSMVVGPDGRYTWHVNPSTRPVVQARQYRLLNSTPLKQEVFTGTTLPLMQTDKTFAVDRAADALEVKLDWPTPDDLDLTVFLVGADGALTQVGQSAGSVGVKERVLLTNPVQGTYVLRVLNYASITPSWTMTASLFDGEEHTVGGLIENWTLTCEKNGKVLETVPVIVDRGQQVKADLKACQSKWATS
ncbi:M14 family zinc carboxypeptidase [Actinokineospora sp.]|uniref:M14 family zinc carboxypeptidase n=1 Tax=Actinokineospora sp. TaxID=1872133 RepID=UPI003D6B0B2C